MDRVDSEWVKVALDLTSGISDNDRFARLLSTIRQSLSCDASALLLFKNQQFIPLAINGLSEDVLGRRFDLDKHPRLEAIARAGDIVRFPSDSDLPDPYDGLIPNHDDDLMVHSCIGLPLMLEDRLIGAVTIDAFDPKQFDSFKNQDLRLISALAASSLNTALLMQKLERYSGLESAATTTGAKGNFSAEIIGQSPAIEELKSHIAAVADTHLSVLIMGETGVGKELVANAIHAQSGRNANNLVYLNCAALPESVAESELFGHVKGAFTGAISNRKGKFEMADKGTLFLDEIGELSLALQAKLLRALQYGDIQRVGDDRNIKVDVRIIAATNRIMHEEVKAGRFRADLYHRLSVFPLFVPPLRERDKDIVLLAGFFAEKCQYKLAVSSIGLDSESLRMIERYPWEGNVRELEHAINRAAVLAKSEQSGQHVVLYPHHFHLGQQSKSSGGQEKVEQAEQQQKVFSSFAHLGLKESVEQFQAYVIQKAYEENGNKLNATAKQLKVDAGNLHRLMKRLNLK